MKRPNPLQHAMDRFTADPASVKNAAYSAEALRRQLDEVLGRLAAIEAALKSSALGASATLPPVGD